MSCMDSPSELKKLKKLLALCSCIGLTTFKCSRSYLSWILSEQCWQFEPDSWNNPQSMNWKHSGACDTSSLLVISCMSVCLKLVQVKNSLLNFAHQTLLPGLGDNCYMWKNYTKRELHEISSKVTRVSIGLLWRLQVSKWKDRLREEEVSSPGLCSSLLISAWMFETNKSYHYWVM